MPSVSAPQRKLMAIAAHTPGGYGGVPQSVGQEFHAADKAVGKNGQKPTSDGHRRVAAVLVRK